MRILLVDDQPLVRDGIASLLRSHGFDVVGEADDGEAGVRKVRALGPDVVLMDIKMPGMGGLEATRRIKAEMPDVKVVMLTVSDDEQDLFEAIKAGAHGYLLKNLRAADLFDALRGLQRGEAPLSRRLAGKLLAEFRRYAEQGPPASPEADLTPRERDVLAQVARGATNKEVAAALRISENTVKFHMKHILEKLHLRNRSHLAAWAAEHGIAVRSHPSG